MSQHIRDIYRELTTGVNVGHRRKYLTITGLCPDMIDLFKSASDLLGLTGDQYLIALMTNAGVPGVVPIFDNDESKREWKEAVLAKTIFDFGRL